MKYYITVQSNNGWSEYNLEVSENTYKKVAKDDYVTVVDPKQPATKYVMQICKRNKYHNTYVTLSTAYIFYGTIDHKEYDENQPDFLKKRVEELEKEVARLEADKIDKPRYGAGSMYYTGF